MFACNISNKIYSTPKLLHSENFEELAPTKTPLKTENNQSNSVTCTVCSKNFSKKSNLNVHIRKYHADHVSSHNIKKSANYICEECGKKFIHLKNLNTHKKQHGFNSNYTKQGAKKCTLCNYSNPFRSNLLLHFTERHNIQIASENFEFNAFTEFKIWKSKIEKETKSFFVKEKGSRKSKTSIVTKYVCHRSGTHVPRGNGMRHLKKQGSNKINGFCPAGLNVLEESKKIKVVYTKVHVGHDCDLEHLCLSTAERQDLASKISLNIPFPAILDEVRDSVSNCKLERLHLLTKKDLHNIKERFHLNSTSMLHIDIRDDKNEELCKTLQSFTRPKNEMTSSDQLQIEKEKLRSVIDSISTVEELQAVKLLMAPIQPTLTAIRNQKTATPSVSATILHNKNIVQQRRFFCTKKITKKEAKVF